MKKIGEFLKTTLLGGTLVLLPLLLFYLLFTEMLDLVIAMADPILDLLPASISDELDDSTALAWVILVACAFLAGLALRSDKLKATGTSFENTVLKKLPIYSAIKRLSHGILGVKGEDAFRCGFVELNPGIRELVYIAEDSGNGYMTIMVPLSPAGFSGPLKIVESAMVTPVDISVGQASVAVSEWGVGLQKLVDQGDR